MKANTRVLLERFIRDGIDHAMMNSDEPYSAALANAIDDRIWLYLDEYFTFDEDN